MVTDGPGDQAASISEAVDKTIGALACPPSDAAVVALARMTARTIDAMPDGQRGMMLGQTAPLLLKLLQELDSRASRRRGAKRESAPGKVSQLRAAQAQVAAKRTRGGR